MQTLECVHILKSCLTRYLLQGVGRVEDRGAGTARGWGRGLGAARRCASAGALHSQALFIVKTKLWQQLLVPIHGQLKDGAGAVTGWSERKKQTVRKVVEGCVSPATQKMQRGNPAKARGYRTLLRGINCAAIYSLYWLQGKHMIGRGEKEFDEGESLNRIKKNNGDLQDLPHYHWQRSGHYPQDSSSAQISSTGYFLLSHYCGSAGHTCTHTGTSERSYFLCWFYAT